MASIFDLLPDSMKNDPNVVNAFNSIMSWLPEGARNSPTVNQMFVEMLTPDETASNASKTARDAESNRQNRLSQGAIDLNNLFQQYGDTVSQQARDSYVASQMPDVQDNYNKNKNQSIYDSFRKGTSQSSSSAKNLSSLFEDYNRSRANVLNNAVSAGNQARSNVDSIRNNVYGSLQNTVNPQAQAQTGMSNLINYTRPQNFSPLAALFEDTLGGVANAAGAQSQGYNNAFSAFFPGVNR